MAVCDSGYGEEADLSPPLAVGVDGCRFGWIAVHGTRTSMRYQLFRAFGELADTLGAARAICVDIPIGLPSRQHPARTCDANAREVLGRRHVTVFPAPCRAACLSVDPIAARQINLETTGRSVSEQALAIRQKIADVDRLLQDRQELRARVREVHPEVCFWALNQRVAVDIPKARADGLDLRMNLLRPLLPGADRLLHEVLRREPRSHVQADDVVDAMAAFVVATAAPGDVRSLPAEPIRDETGLAMEMLFVDC